MRFDRAWAVVGIALLSCGGLIVIARARMIEPGRLVAPDSDVVWKSSSLRGGIESLRAHVEVPLVNRGGATVRVTGVELGCGCTTPTVLPLVIEPAGNAVLSLVGTPLSSGERTVTITIRTDSPATPEILVRLTMISNRRPPFVHGVSGDFAYSDEASLSEVRDFVVTTVETIDRDKTPAVASDLPFLSFSEPRVQDSSYDEAALKWRTYTYRVSFRDRPQGSFTGRIWVDDPWSGSRPMNLLVMRTVTPRIRVVPSILELNVVGEGEATGKLLVLTSASEPRMIVAPVGEGSDGLAIEEPGKRAEARLRTFAIRARLTGTKDVETRSLIVRASADDREGVIVPIVLRRAGR